jgi:hypothetical protein
MLTKKNRPIYLNKDRNNELAGQLKSSKTTYNFLKQEFEEYKAKATKTLQAKDRLIATLKDSSNLNSEDGSSPGGLNLKSIEIDELKLERDSLKEELNSKSVSLELIKAEMMVKSTKFFLLKVSIYDTFL